MKEMKKFLKEWGLVGLVILVLFCIYFYLSELKSIIPDLSGGLLVEIVGAILTLWLIERVLRKNEEKHRIRMEKAALRSFRFTVVDLLNLFWNMRRAAAIASLVVPPANWREAIASDAAINDIRHLDFMSDAGILPPLTWNNYATQVFQNTYLPAIRRLIDSYAPFLSAELVEKIEALNSSELFSRIFLQAASLSRIPDGPTQLPLLAGMTGFLKNTINDLLDLVDIYNDLCPEKAIAFDGRDLSENSAPLLGTGRVEFAEE